MKKPTNWRNSFTLFQEVTIAASGEKGHVVGETINNSFLVRYRRADGVGVETWWPADALVASSDGDVVQLRVVQ